MIRRVNSKRNKSVTKGNENKKTDGIRGELNNDLVINEDIDFGRVRISRGHDILTADWDTIMYCNLCIYTTNGNAKSHHIYQNAKN